MRLFNQTKSPLSWKMAGKSYGADPWGPVDVPDGLVAAAKKLGLPLAGTPVDPELRAKQKVADDEATRGDQVLLALRQKVEAAERAERYAKQQLDERDVELSKVRSSLREANELCESLRDQLTAAKADAKAAEGLLGEQSAKAAAAEERAIKAEALAPPAAEKPKPAKRAS